MLDKDIVLLGMRDEVLPIDLNYTDEREVELMIDFIHKIAYTELLSRNVGTMTEWSVRALNLFTRHNLVLVGHVMGLTKNEVNRLTGCGYKTRKEIYETYKSYGLIISNWEPGQYYDKMNYKFEDNNGKSEIVTIVSEKEDDTV